MPRKKGVATSRRSAAVGPISLKALGDHLGLSPATLSLVLNRSPAASSIPQETQDRIFAAAEEFNYHPNFLARSLRRKRTYTIGVIVPEVSGGYASGVLSGIEDHLMREGYFYFLVSHRHKPDLIEECPGLLLERAVEGLIAIDTPCRKPLRVPVIAVSRHEDAEGVTNIVLDHQRAADLALAHLVELGHRRIAFIKGQTFSSDTEARWQAFNDAARRLGIVMPAELTAQLEGESPSPEPGYRAARELLAQGGSFSALVAFNDVSAIGAIRALREAGRRVPEDVSVIGFDDIESAAFQNPALTTVRQPLWQMGALAAETVLQRILSNGDPKLLRVEPELIVRESTTQAPGVTS
jgi:DNA-binding LacI/PurR family transcriptional regulator